jgi:hypothetical protein
MSKRTGEGKATCMLHCESEEAIEVPGDKDFDVGRNSFAGYKSIGGCSRTQLVLHFTEGTLQCKMIKKNPSFRWAKTQWEKLPSVCELQDGDRLRLVNEGPEVVVKITGVRKIKYRKEEEKLTICQYGLKCVKLDDEEHLKRYSHEIN